METREQKLSPSYEYIFSLSKPRRVHVKAVTRIILGALPLASVFLIYAGVQTMRASDQIGTHLSPLDLVVLEFVFPAILIAISSATFWTVRRDKALLRDGELAIGVVTHQRVIAVRGGRGGSRKQSRIRYRFKDPAGQLFQGTGTDHSQRLQVNMTVPVFYKPENPEKNVSICTAVCELGSN
jgi:hypothetical protein